MEKSTENQVNSRAIVASVNRELVDFALDGFSLSLESDNVITRNNTRIILSSPRLGGYNNNGFYNTSLGYATVPSTGYYDVDGQVTFSWNTLSNTTFYTTLNVTMRNMSNNRAYVNTFCIYNANINNNDEISIPFSRKMFLNAGEQYYLNFSLTGPIVNFEQVIHAVGTYLSIHRIA